jgi:hypothetical protein
VLKDPFFSLGFASQFVCHPTSGGTITVQGHLVYSLVYETQVFVETIRIWGGGEREKVFNDGISCSDYIASVIDE